MERHQLEELDLHLQVSNMHGDEEDLITGFAIRERDLTGFLIDLDSLVRRYGGAKFSELLDEDPDDIACDAAIKTELRHERELRADDTVAAEVVSSVSDNRVKHIDGVVHLPE